MLNFIIEAINNNLTTSWSLVVGLLIAFINIRYYEGKEFRVAANEFSEIICTELKEIYPEWNNDSIPTYAYLGGKFYKLERAVKKFRRHLPWYKRRAFSKAWRTYYNERGKDSGQFYRHYTPAKGSLTIENTVEKWDYTETYKHNFKHNVDALLKFAK